VPGHTSETFKPLTSIKKESETRKEQLKIYRKEARKFVTTHNKCELKMEGCEKESACVHHTKGREGDLLLDQKFWKASCLSCNLQVEIKDAEARSKDLKLSKFNLKTTNA
jgi:hypothetical protein